MGETSISAEHLRRPLPWSPETLSIFLAASMGRLVSAILLWAAGQWSSPPDTAHSATHRRPCAVGAVGALHLDGHRPFGDVGGTRPHPLPLGHSALRPGAISLVAAGRHRICCHNGHSELPPQADSIGVGPGACGFFLCQMDCRSSGVSHPASAIRRDRARSARCRRVSACRFRQIASPTSRESRTSPSGATSERATRWWLTDQAR